MRTRVLATLSVLVFTAGAAGLAQAASTPAQKCAATKLKATTRRVAAELKCHRKALVAGREVDPLCLAKAQARFDAAFAKAEARGGCDSVGETADVEAALDQFVEDAVAALEPRKSFAANVQPIFDANCTSCHDGALPPAGLNLEPDLAYGEIVNVDSFQIPALKRVLPFDPANSYLFQKITGADGILNNPMPIGGFPMTDAEIATIEAWITQGAADN
jgi:mono/diheme cytochrome c family protein